MKSRNVCDVQIYRRQCNLSEWQKVSFYLTSVAVLNIICIMYNYPCFLMTMIFRKLLKNFVQWTCVIHCVCEYVGDFVMCEGPSMEPTLYSDDVLIIERISTRLQKLKKGDIIISKCPSKPKQHICKRVIGLPGNIVQNGITVPNGHVWLEGDNSNNSTDSRVYGPVPQGLLRGRALCKILPLRDISFLVTDP